MMDVNSTDVFYFLLKMWGKSRYIGLLFCQILLGIHKKNWQIKKLFLHKIKPSNHCRNLRLNGIAKWLSWRNNQKPNMHDQTGSALQVVANPWNESCWVFKYKGSVGSVFRGFAEDIILGVAGEFFTNLHNNIKTMTNIRDIYR